MGVTLLHRTNRSVAVTPQRAQYYEQVSRLRKDLLYKAFHEVANSWRPCER
jgi:hypothetical protein